LTKISNRHLEVDKIGLRKLAYRRGAGWVFTELLQNALDENVNHVRIDVGTTPGLSLVKLRVEDDSPHGFRKLSDAFTFFAESCKKNVPDKRGRFNLGEKLVLAICESAVISTTTGTIEFAADGTRMEFR